MDSEEFTAFVRTKPFRPYRLTLTDGRTYDIVHPDMAFVGFGSVIVGFPPLDQQESDSDRDILVSLMHVMQIEFVDAPPNASGAKPSNGKKKE